MKRRLLIESIAVVGHKRRRDEDSVFAKEDRRRRVEGKVTTGRVRGAHAAVRVGGTIRFTLKELLAGEGVVRGTIRREIHHGLVHLTRVTVTDTGGAHRLEPVAVHGRAVVHGPVEHRLGDDVSLQLGLDPGLILEQLGALAVLVQVLLRDRTTEAAGTVPLRRGRTRAHREHRLRPDAASPFRDARAPRLAANRADLRRQAHFLTQRRLFTSTHRTSPSVIALTSRARVYPLDIPHRVIDNPLRARSSPPPRVASPIPDRSIDRSTDRPIDSLAHLHVAASNAQICRARSRPAVESDPIAPQFNSTGARATPRDVDRAKRRARGGLDMGTHGTRVRDRGRALRFSCVDKKRAGHVRPVVIGERVTRSIVCRTDGTRWGGDTHGAWLNLRPKQLFYHFHITYYTALLTYPGEIKTRFNTSACDE